MPKLKLECYWNLIITVYWGLQLWDLLLDGPMNVIINQNWSKCVRLWGSESCVINQNGSKMLDCEEVRVVYDKNKCL